ncbi:hypothetical protein DRN93_02430 [archaeon]|nr:MAG: hypothetical protein DRN93_02430 [archaeon]
MINEHRSTRSTASLYGQEHWEKAAKKFSTTYTESDPAVRREAEKKISFIERHLMKKGSLLDVGCSFGFLVVALRDRGWDAYGIDTSEYALGKAPTRVQPYVSRMSVEKLEFEDNRFDIVTAFDILEHLYIEQIFAAAKEISRVAGRFVLLRLPIQSPYTEIWLTDISYRSFDKGHISIYPWQFWVRRFEEVGKFERWFIHIYKGPGSDADECWIVFRRREGKK